MANQNNNNNIDSDVIFILLDYNEIHKKQKFSAPDIAEPRVKRCGLFHMLTCVDIIA